eukprot:gene12520-13804_t
MPMFNRKLIFSKLDLKKVFHQLELDTASCPLTVFRLGDHLMRYEHLTVSTLPAFGELNQRPCPILSSILNTAMIQDDIVLAATVITSHNSSLEHVLAVLANAGLTVGPPKCTFPFGLSPILKQGTCTDAAQAVVASDAEKNYSQLDFEAIAIDFALRQFRHILVRGPAAEQELLVSCGPLKENHFLELNVSFFATKTSIIALFGRKEGATQLTTPTDTPPLSINCLHALRKKARCSETKHPGLDTAVQNCIETCHECQIHTRSTIKVPLSSTPIPDHPWDSVSLDLFGPLPVTSHILVSRCNLSRFPDAKVVPTTTAEHMLPAPGATYNNFGNPKEHQANNGPAFKSQEFKYFSASRGTSVKHSYPYPP